MKRKRHTTSEAVRKRHVAEVLAGQGQTIGRVCPKLEMSERTLRLRRKQLRGNWDAAVPPRSTQRVRAVLGARECRQGLPNGAGS